MLTPIRIYRKITVVTYTLTLDKQRNKDFCLADIAFQAEMVILGRF